jgi:hypothetical protein
MFARAVFDEAVYDSVLKAESVKRISQLSAQDIILSRLKHWTI